MKKAYQDALSIILTAAAVAIAVSVVWGQFFTPRNAQAYANSRRTAMLEYFAGWTTLIENGITIGDSSAPVKVAVFTDFECGFCSLFHETQLREVKAQFGDSVAVVYLHLPLEAHRFAKAAARAAECAALEGRFAEFVDVVFDKQDSIGLKTWASYGQEATVPELSQFSECVERESSFPRIDSGLALAERLGPLGTPTVIVNGWRYHGTPNTKALSGAIRSLLDGREPFAERPQN